MKVWNTGAGSGMSSVLEMQESKYRLLFRKGWNDVVRAGIHAAGQHFVSVYLPKRFTSYAETDLGYTPANVTKSMPGKLPLVLTGRLRAYLLERAYPEARATENNATLYIRMPVPSMMTTQRSGGFFGLFTKSVRNKDSKVSYYYNEKVSRVLKRITDHELADMAVAMNREMQRLINGATTTVNNRGRKTLALTNQQHQSIAHTTKPQQSAAHSTVRAA